MEINLTFMLWSLFAIDLLILVGLILFETSKAYNNYEEADHNRVKCRLGAFYTMSILFGVILFIVGIASAVKDGSRYISLGQLVRFESDSDKYLTLNERINSIEEENKRLKEMLIEK